MAQWFEEQVNLIPLPSEKVAWTEDLYQGFTRFSEKRGERPLPYQAFVQKLAALVPDAKKREHRLSTGKRPRGFLGLVLQLEGFPSHVGLRGVPRDF